MAWGRSIRLEQVKGFLPKAKISVFFVVFCLYLIGLVEVAVKNSGFSVPHSSSGEVPLSKLGIEKIGRRN
jgi:hypothetical protein